MIGDVVDLFKGQLVYSELNQVFILKLDPSGKGLPDVAIYDTFLLLCLVVFFSNVLPLLSPIQCTISDETITYVSQNKHSSDLVVTDYSFQGCILC